MNQKTKINSKPYFNMKELQKIYDACCNAVGEDLGTQKRKRSIVYARYCFFFFAREITASTLTEIGEICGCRDHSTVHIGLRKYHNLKHLKDFKKVFDIIEAELPMSDTKKRILELKIENDALKKDVETLKKRMQSVEVEQEILDMFNKLPTDKLFELKEYRIKPFLKMNSL